MAKTFKWSIGSALCIVLAGACLPAVADVVSELAVHRVIAGADGKEAVEPAASAKPGDVLEYAVAYRNTGSSAARQLEATLPIPQGTAFVLGTAQPAGARASVDGVTFSPLPLMRKVRKADGTQADQAVPVEQYRYLRWAPQDLPSGAVAHVTARVKLTADAAPTDVKK